MRSIKIILVGIIGFVATFPAQAQSTLEPINGVYVKETTPDRKPIPYAPLREADVMWSRKIWRQIDLREKINLPLYYPFEETNGIRSLAQILYDAIVTEGIVQPYSNTRDDFTLEMTVSDFQRMVNKTREITTKSLLNPDEDSVVTIQERFQPNKVKKYIIKEEWFFDKQRSVLDVRIIGICPLYENEDKEKGDTPLFWVYFPHIRELLAKNEVFNRFNAAERRTFDDIFWKRYFGSYIIKEENVYDRFINEYEKGIDALYEAQRVKDAIINFEHDLWEY